MQKDLNLDDLNGNKKKGKNKIKKQIEKNKTC